MNKCLPGDITEEIEVSMYFPYAKKVVATNRGNGRLDRAFCGHKKLINQWMSSRTAIYEVLIT